MMFAGKASILRPRQRLKLFRSITLRINNTERNSLDVLDVSSQGKPLTWYSCGPTVYDSAHLGHARTYVSTDIIRRILNYHFQIPLHFAMGITDIDDKIIAKGKLEGYGNDRSNYLQLAERYEREFFFDLDRLNVLRPDAVLKVSHYIPEIIDFVQNLLDQKYAYQTSQGVYFKVQSLPVEKEYDRFGVIPTSLESRLDPPTSVEPDQDYDGNLTTKTNVRDFALWKSFPRSEPGWESPWGWGRPGWHIECSTMTYQYFGKRLDIHSGGVDLKFPHHTNEIVQSECHHGHCRAGESWVKVWLHTGHLHITGRKMSKSLKNFISIHEYFQQQITTSPADDFRIFCLQYKYSSAVTYSPDRILEAATFRKKLENYFLVATHLLRIPPSSSSSNMSANLISHPAQNARPTIQSKQLLEQFHQIKAAINEAFRDDFDTGRALQHLSELISLTSEYMKLLSTPESSDRHQQPIEPIIVITHYLQQLGGNVFGLQCCTNIPELKLTRATGDSQQDKSDGADGISSEMMTIALAYRSEIRKQVIQRMKEVKAQLKQPSSEERKQSLEAELECLKKLLTAGDTFRNQCKDRLGIEVIDVKNGDSSTWRKIT